MKVRSFLHKNGIEYIGRIRRQSSMARDFVLSFPRKLVQIHVPISTDTGVDVVFKTVLQPVCLSCSEVPELFFNEEDVMFEPSSVSEELIQSYWSLFTRKEDLPKTT